MILRDHVFLCDGRAVRRPFAVPHLERHATPERA